MREGLHVKRVRRSGQVLWHHQRRVAREVRMLQVRRGRSCRGHQARQVGVGQREAEQ